MNRRLKEIVMSVAIVFFIIATCFGVSKFSINPEANSITIKFNEYRIEASEIAISSNEYTAEGVEVSITSEAMNLANEGKVDPDNEGKLMTIQYFLGELNENGTAGENDTGWIDYIGDGFVVSENTKVNARLVCKAEDFYGPITTVEITNIAVARIAINSSNDGETEYVYYKTLNDAIAACPEDSRR